MSIRKIVNSIFGSKNQNASNIMQNKFRLNTLHVKLTYPKKNSDGISIIKNKEILHNCLLGKFNTKKANIKTLITAYEISDELYEHYHCYINFDRKIDLKDSRFFDVLGIHGDYSAIKGSVSSYIEYTKKDGSCMIYDPGLNSNPTGHKTKTQIMAYLAEKVVLWKTDKRYARYNNLSMAELYFKAAQSLSKLDAIYFCENIDQRVKQFISYMRMNYPHIYDENNVRYLKSKFEFPQEIQNWEKNYKYTKTLYIYGPSNLGKTEASKAILQPALLARSLQQTKNFIYGYHKGIILDDTKGLHNLSREEAVALFDRENNSCIDIKHSHVDVTHSIPMIIVSNLPLSDIMPDSCYTLDASNKKVLRPEIKRRIVCYEMTIDLRKKDH